MSILPTWDKELITKGWQRVETGEKTKRTDQYFSIYHRKWKQCNPYSLSIVLYEGLYRRPIAFIPWVNVITRLTWQFLYMPFTKKPRLNKK